jgi:hypothetical protein
MALDETDKQEVAKLVKSEISRALAEVSKAGSLEVRSVGTPIDTQKLTAARPGRMLASDNCCNGCD